MNKLLILLAASFSVTAFANEFTIVNKKVGSATLPFVQNVQGVEDRYNKKADFAYIEKVAPLTQEQLASLNANDLRNISMEDFNQIYARLDSGPMPFGDYSAFVLQKPTVYNAIRERVLAKTGAFAKAISFLGSACGKSVEDCLFEFIWKGKRFYKKNDMDQTMSKSTVNFVSSVLKQMARTESTVDFAEGVIDKASLTFFPMNTYCGLSQVDTRRESIIVDGTHAQMFTESYFALIDEVVTQKGLAITEEYRMVRPGLYMGKVYTNKLFLFNVAIEKTGTSIPKETANACADGSKTR